MKTSRYAHRFVESFPRPLEEGVVYISTRFPCVAHSCACGCKREVVTNLSPTDWKLSFDGVGVSLHPSIGNWRFPCRSHYWIKGGAVEWSYDMTEEEIQRGRRRDLRAKDRYYSPPSAPARPTKPAPVESSPPHTETGWVSRLKRWLGA